MQMDLAIGKSCAKCGTWRLLSDFAITRGKHHSYCKPCKRAYDKARYRNDPEHRQRTIDRANTWQAANYERAEARWRDWRVKNRDRKNETERKRRLKDPERNRLIAVNRAQRRRKWLHAGGSFVVTLAELASIRRSPCFACGARDNIQVDHVIPVARGGQHRIGNLMPLCQHCNVSKGKLTWAEWRYSSRPRAVEIFGRAA